MPVMGTPISLGKNVVCTNHKTAAERPSFCYTFSMSMERPKTFKRIVGLAAMGVLGTLAAKSPVGEAVGRVVHETLNGRELLSSAPSPESTKETEVASAAKQVP
jgi:hypothetical protein